MASGMIGGTAVALQLVVAATQSPGDAMPREHEPECGEGEPRRRGREHEERSRSRCVVSVSSAASGQGFTPATIDRTRPPSGQCGADSRIRVVVDL